MAFWPAARGSQARSLAEEAFRQRNAGAGGPVSQRASGGRGALAATEAWLASSFLQPQAGSQRSTPTGGPSARLATCVVTGPSPHHHLGQLTHFALVPTQKTPS